MSYLGKCVVMMLITIILLYGQLTIDWWQEKKQK